MPRHEAYGPRRNCEYRLLQACFRRGLFAAMIAQCTGKYQDQRSRKQPSSRKRDIAHDNNPFSPTSVTEWRLRIGQRSPLFPALLIRSRRRIMTGGLVSQGMGLMHHKQTHFAFGAAHSVCCYPRSQHANKRFSGNHFWNMASWQRPCGKALIATR